MPVYGLLGSCAHINVHWQVYTYIILKDDFLFLFCLQGFFCDSEKDFNELCKSLRAFAHQNKDMMFEICKDRPPHLQYNFDTVIPSFRKTGMMSICGLLCCLAWAVSSSCMPSHSQGEIVISCRYYECGHYFCTCRLY